MLKIHFVVFTARCYAERVLPRQVVRPSVSDVEVLWSYNFGSFENNYLRRQTGVFALIAAPDNISLVKEMHP